METCATCKYFRQTIIGEEVGYKRVYSHCKLIDDNSSPFRLTGYDDNYNIDDGFGCIMHVPKDKPKKMEENIKSGS